MDDDVPKVPESTLYAQVETPWAIKDYSPSRSCVRLVGVDTTSFQQQSFNTESGCPTFLVDVDWRDAWFPGMPYHGPAPAWWGALEEEGAGIGRDWWRIGYEISKEVTNSYAYPLFEAADPTYLQILSIDRVDGPEVAPLAGPHDVFRPATMADPDFFRYTAFHVGQGMASLFHGRHVGVLLDAGAGVPVNRRDYMRRAHTDGTPFLNELLPMVVRLQETSAVLSHPDADHWRLLDWDRSLLDHLQRIYVPAGARALALAAPRVKGKVSGVGNMTMQLNRRNRLDLYRSQPSRSDSNGECLVALVRCEGRVALAAGDYVYQRMKSDGNAAIVGASAQLLDAVMVPHHGDEASATNPPPPRQPGVSPAFFSAGTHQGYGHPHSASTLSHQMRGFQNIERCSLRDVIARQLLP